MLISMTTTPILKNLHSVLNYGVERYNYEFLNQDILLNDAFKSAFRNYVLRKGGDVEYFNFTSTVTTSKGQHIFIANQWFAGASYLVDFCTELLTYQEYFEKICSYQRIEGKQKKTYAEALKSCPSDVDKQHFLSTCITILNEEFPGHTDINNVANFLWRFASDYSWWAGSKTIDRHDFYISPVLSLLNVVNANAEYLAEIVHYYASDLTLRKFAECLENFTINAKTRENRHTMIGEHSNHEIEQELIPIIESNSHGISISAASLERFQSYR